MDKPVINSFNEFAEILIQKYERYLPTAFDESLTLLEKMNNVIQYMNDVGKLTNDVVKQWNDVMEWVLSDGIGTNVVDKLNEMVSNGQMASIINNTIFNDLNTRVNTVTSTVNTEAVKMAELRQNMYYRNITSQDLLDVPSATHYTVTIIPKYDENNQMIAMKNGFANETPNGGTGETARSFAKRNKTSLTVNCQIFDVTTLKLVGLCINKGTVVSETVTTGTPKYVLAWKTSDRTFKWYNPNTPSSTILSAGYDNAITGFTPLIDNGVKVAQFIQDGYSEWLNRHPRQAFGVRSNGDIIFVSCAGRGIDGEAGMTCDDLVRILLTYGVQIGFNMDGGGSTQTVVRGVNKVLPYDNNGIDERLVPHFLFFSPTVTQTPVNLDISNAFSDIGEVRKKADETEIKLYGKYDFNNGFLQIKAPDGYKTQGIEIWEGNVKKTKLIMQEDQIAYWDYTNNKTVFKVLSDGSLSTAKGLYGDFFYRAQVPSDLNTITSSGIYWSTMSVPNNPNGTNSFVVQHIQFDGNNALQLATQFSSGATISKKRRLASGVWEAWV